MKLKIEWKALARQLWDAVKPVLLGAIGVAVVTHSAQEADNKGDDENRPTQANPVSVDVPIR